jgi:hypothetical protein
MYLQNQAYRQYQQAAADLKVPIQSLIDLPLSEIFRYALDYASLNSAPKENVGRPDQILAAQTLFRNNPLHHRLIPQTPTVPRS